MVDNTEIHIDILDGELSLVLCEELISNEANGGNCFFTGTVRNHSRDKEVVQLDYSSYSSMAKKEIQKICDRAASLWPIRNIVVHHRVGILGLCDKAVIIGIGSTHRKEAFAACEYIIDELKKSVPIWKKESYVDGESWIGEGP